MKGSLHTIRELWDWPTLLSDGEWYAWSGVAYWPVYWRNHFQQWVFHNGCDWTLVVDGYAVFTGGLTACLRKAEL